MARASALLPNLPKPVPNADQAVPFHLAMLFPGMKNAPAAYRSVPETASEITSGRAPPPMPAPSADQVLPFHLAILRSDVEPDAEKMPPRSEEHTSELQSL